MKRYFLVIVLATVMFLGLGNITMGQFDNGVLQCDQTNLLSDQQKLFCDCGIQPELWDTIGQYVDYSHINKKEGGGCCALTSAKDLFNGILPVCTQEYQNAGEECVPYKANAHTNGFGLCVCDDGYKNVDGVCKSCSDPGVCCGIELNTSVPFIGKCIEDKSSYQSSDETSVTGDTAFPVLMGSLTQILVTVILIISFVLIVIGGIMIATGNPSGGKKMIIKVVIGIALLGASGVILRLINPNFFG